MRSSFVRSPSPRQSSTSYSFFLLLCSTPDLTISSMAENPEGFIKLLRHMVQSYINHPEQDGYDEWIDPNGTFDRFYAIQRTTKGEVPLHRAIRNMQAAVNGDRQTYICRFVFGVLYKMVSRNLLSAPNILRDRRSPPTLRADTILFQIVGLGRTKTLPDPIYRPPSSPAPPESRSRRQPLRSSNRRSESRHARCRRETNSKRYRLRD